MLLENKVSISVCLPFVLLATSIVANKPVVTRIEGTLSAEDSKLPITCHECEVMILNVIINIASAILQTPAIMDTAENQNPSIPTDASKTTDSNITTVANNSTKIELIGITGNGPTTAYELLSKFATKNYSASTEDIPHSNRNISNSVETTTERPRASGGETNTPISVTNTGFGEVEKIATTESSIPHRKFTKRYMENLCVVKWHAENDEREKKKKMTLGNLYRVPPPPRTTQCGLNFTRN